MGSGIAEACARAGLDVRVVDLDQATLSVGASGWLPPSPGPSKAASCQEPRPSRPSSDIDSPPTSGRWPTASWSIEAVVESESEKVAVFQSLDKIVEDPVAILASNTSVHPDHEAGHGHQPAEPGHRDSTSSTRSPCSPLVELVTSF